VADVYTKLETIKLSYNHNDRFIPSFPLCSLLLFLLLTPSGKVSEIIRLPRIFQHIPLKVFISESTENRFFLLRQIPVSFSWRVFLDGLFDKDSAH